MVSDAWRLIKPFWGSKEWKSAWGLSLAVIALNLGGVGIGVMINAWNKSFYNALQTFDKREMFNQVGVFAGIIVAAVSMSVFGLYLNQMLQLKVAPVADQQVFKFLALRTGLFLFADLKYDGQP